MMRMIGKLVAGIVVLAALAVLGYASFGDMAAVAVETRVPVSLPAEAAPVDPAPVNPTLAKPAETNGN